VFLSKSMEKTILRMINSKSARDAYVRAEVSTFLAHQVRALRNQRGWSQKELAEKIKTKQSFISRIEDPSYGKISLKTLFDLSQAFDVGLQVKFISLVSMVKSTFFPKYSEKEVVPFDEESKLVSYYTSKTKDGMLPLVEQNKLVGYLEPKPVEEIVVTDANIYHMCINLPIMEEI
jgi:transcriptional regulator with XRE-family HTH domain